MATIGLSTLKARVVEVAVLKLRQHGPPETFHTLVNPVCPILTTATEIHGITDADVVGKPTFDQVAAPLGYCLRDCDLAGFNLVNFDLPVLSDEFDRSDVPFSLFGRAVRPWAVTSVTTPVRVKIC